MLEENIYKVFLKYIIPSIFGLLCISSASIVDGYFVGNFVGSEALASINIAYPVFSILLGISLMFAVGNSVIFSKLSGEKNIEKALNVFSKTMILIIFFSISISYIISINLNSIFDLMGVYNELRELSNSYLGIILAFIPFLMVGIVFDYFVRADENPNLSFIAMLVSAALNIILDYIFIVKFELGLKGAAFATGISYMSIILTLFPHILSKTHKLKFVKPIGSFLEPIKALKNGMSEFVNESSAGITVLIFNITIIKYIGAQGVSAYTIVSYFIMTIIMVSFAIGDGLQPIIAKHFGANEFKRIKLFARLGFVSVVLFAVIFTFVTITFPDFFVDIFLSDEGGDVKNITLEFLGYAWISFVFIGINILTTSYLTAIQKPMQSAVISLLRSLILPILFIIILTYIFDVIGIYLSIVFSEFITFVLAMYFLKKA